LASSFMAAPSDESTLEPSLQRLGRAQFGHATDGEPSSEVTNGDQW
jgi:hypothetical protein